MRRKSFRDIEESIHPSSPRMDIGVLCITRKLVSFRYQDIFNLLSYGNPTELFGYPIATSIAQAPVQS